MARKPSLSSSLSALTSSAIAMCLTIAGCGGSGPVAEAVAPWTASSLHHVYVRGGPAPEGTSPRVAITINGPDRCALRTLEALKSPGEGLKALPVTFFWSPERVRLLRQTKMEVAEGEGPSGQEAWSQIISTVAEDGHELALLAEPVYARWQSSPEDLAAGLDEGRAILQSLDPRGEEGTLPLGWRPPVDAIGPKLMRTAGEVGQPVMLWSLHVDARSPEALVQALSGRLGDGDIVVIDVAGAEGEDAVSRPCVVAEAAEGIARALDEAGLKAVTLADMLGSAWRRFEPLRLTRYQGPGLSEACAEALELPYSAQSEREGPRWAIVDRRWRSGALRVMPLPGADASTTRIMTQWLSEAQSLWKRRGRWRGLPACLQAVPEGRILSPITLAHEGDGVASRWWWVGAEGVEERRPRMLTGPSRPLVLPARDDLLRIEALNGTSRRLRGVVSEALEHLGLEAPMLVEGRSAIGVVVGDPETPGAVGYVPVVEFALGEYRFLAALSPGEAGGLDRAARGAEGFFRAGPWITIPQGPGAWPRPHGIRLNGAQGLPDHPTRLLSTLDALGASPRPGDVLVPHPGPDIYAGLIPPTGERLGRHIIRKKLQRLLKLAFKHGQFMRPGHVMQIDADALGQQAVRVALAPGVAPLLGGVDPLVEQGAPGRSPEGAGAEDLPRR
ncbi:MAG: hypothetical protein ACE366_06045 [Bradymonadia bacterium]